MASLTPGVLLKLLQSMNTDTKVAGEHRSAVLQVVGIVPALSASTADDLWPSHGFYIQLSDSVNSTYVALSDADADAVLSTRSQLGQLVHVDRLQFAHPVPRAVGLRPVPGARPHPFMGSPEPLVARSSPNHYGFVIQSPSPSEAGPPLVPSSTLRSISQPEEEKRTVFAAKENVVGAGKNNGCAAIGVKPRRHSSPATTKVAPRKSTGGGSNDAAGHRHPSPAAKASSRPSSPSLCRSASRPSSPIPSKCEVPGLTAAKEENRRTSKEPAIIVPSRYRQPSPVGRKAAASPMARRGSMSPARRLSGGFKLLSPAPGEGGGKKKLGIVVAGTSKVADALIGSAKSVRKSWDDSPGSLVKTLEKKEKVGSKSKVDKEAILRTQISMSRRLSDTGGLSTDNDDVISEEKPRTSNKIELLKESEKRVIMPQKVIIHEKKWTDGSIPLDSVSARLSILGKEALQRKHVACKAAAEALEEALANEAVIRCLSMFSELCSSSKSQNILATMDSFLPVYDDILKWNIIIESLCASRNVDGFKDAISTGRSKSVSLWVEAALATDLEVLRLLNNGSEKLAERLEIAALGPPKTSLSKRQNVGSPANTLPKASASNLTNSTWTRGYGVSETLDLAKVLRREMQLWFLKFLEDAMDSGFRLFGAGADGGQQSNVKENGKAAAVLSQLKRINDWLDGVSRSPEADTLKEKIDGVKRKIYGFVITHVGSAFETSVSVKKS